MRLTWQQRVQLLTYQLIADCLVHQAEWPTLPIGLPVQQQPQETHQPEPAPPAQNNPPLAGENVMNVIMVGAECAPWSKTGVLLCSQTTKVGRLCAASLCTAAKGVTELRELLWFSKTPLGGALCLHLPSADCQC